MEKMIIYSNNFSVICIITGKNQEDCSKCAASYNLDDSDSFGVTFGVDSGLISNKYTVEIAANDLANPDIEEALATCIAKTC